MFVDLCTVLYGTGTVQKGKRWVKYGMELATISQKISDKIAVFYKLFRLYWHWNVKILITPSARVLYLHTVKSVTSQRIM